jgi:hypothetical protein
LTCLKIEVIDVKPSTFQESGQRLLAPEAVHKSLVLPKDGKDQKELLHLLAKIAKRIQVARTYAENWISQCGGLVGG